MPKTTDTYERAYQACAVLAARGINPTVRTVAEAIGTNSPAIISPAIKDWKQSVAVESLRRLEIPEAPQPLADATVALWRLAVEEAQSALAQQREALAGERAGLLAQLARAREANVALAAALEETRRTLARQRAGWEEKFDRDHAWHLARIAEERERARREAEEHATRLQEALALSRQYAATLDGHLGQAAAANTDLRGELKAVREENGGLRQALEAARNKAEDNARQRDEQEQRLAEAQIRLQAAGPKTGQRRARREKRPGIAKPAREGKGGQARRAGPLAGCPCSGRNGNGNPIRLHLGGGLARTGPVIATYPHFLWKSPGAIPPKPHPP